MVETFIFLGTIRFNWWQSFFNNVERGPISIKVKIIKDLLKVTAFLFKLLSKSVLHIIDFFFIYIESKQIYFYGSLQDFICDVCCFNFSNPRMSENFSNAS